MAEHIRIRIVRDDGEEFNIGESFDWRLMKNGLDGFGSFDNELNFVDNGTHDGGLITSKRLTKKDRSIKAGFVHPNQNTLERQKVQAFFNPKADYRLYITVGDRTLWGECSVYKKNVPISVETQLLTLDVTFMFPNPFLKSFDDFGADIASKTELIAFPYLVSLDKYPRGLTGGLYNFQKEVYLINDGDVETYCRAEFRAIGNVVNPYLMIGDKYVRLNDTLESGDLVIMDFTTLPPRVTKNGANFIGHCDRTSNFTDMAMKVGDVTIEYGADDGEINLSVSFFYNKLYTSI